jgi:hypothetical protein
VGNPYLCSSTGRTDTTTGQIHPFKAHWEKNLSKNSARGNCVSLTLPCSRLRRFAGGSSGTSTFFLKNKVPIGCLRGPEKSHVVCFELNSDKRCGPGSGSAVKRPALCILH